MELHDRETLDRDILEKLLTLIENNECKLAIKTWSDHRHQTASACNHCPYKPLEADVDCSVCLERKLRIMSLSEHGSDKFEQSLLNAALKLDQYHHQTR